VRKRHVEISVWVSELSTAQSDGKDPSDGVNRNVAISRKRSHERACLSRSPLRRRPLAWITRKRARAGSVIEILKRSFSSPQVASAQTTSRALKTSAERSEAREVDVPRLLTCRVASPLVMATRGKGARRHDVPWVPMFHGCRCSMGASCACVPLATTSCCAGGSATRNDHQLRCPSLRLRCAPPSAASRAVHAKASESGGRGEAAPPPVASAQTYALKSRHPPPKRLRTSPRKRTICPCSTGVDAFSTSLAQKSRKRIAPSSVRLGI